MSTVYEDHINFVSLSNTGTQAEWDWLVDNVKMDWALFLGHQNASIAQIVGFMFAAAAEYFWLLCMLYIPLESYCGWWW